MSYGYVGLKLNSSSADAIYSVVNNIGVEGVVFPNDMHVTIMYDVRNVIETVDISDKNFVASLTNISMFGDYDDRWSAIVIELECLQLRQRYRELVSMGFTHSYDEFRPHVTIKYCPTLSDYAVLKTRFNPANIGESGIVFLESEFWERAY